MTTSEEIHLTFTQRKRMAKKAVCPNCKSEEFYRKLGETESSKNNPMPKFRKGRPIIQCAKCGYWTDVFDGWIWRPKEALRP